MSGSSHKAARPRAARAKLLAALTALALLALPAAVPAPSLAGGPDEQGNLYEGQDDYNTGVNEIHLSIDAPVRSVTLEEGESRTLECSVSPLEGVLHTKKNGDILFKTQATAVSSDASVARMKFDVQSARLDISALKPGDASVTVSAHLVYADPVSVTISVHVDPLPEEDADDVAWGGAGKSGGAEPPPAAQGSSAGGEGAGDGGVEGARGQAETNVRGGTGQSARGALTTDTDTAQAASPVQERLAAAKAGAAKTVKLREISEKREQPAPAAPDAAVPLGLALFVSGACAACVAYGAAQAGLGFRRQLV